MSTAHSTLDTRISSVIEKHPHLKRRKVHVETHKGHVVLRGTVETYYQKQMAQEALRRLEGVERIDNHLEVSWA